MNQTAAGGTFRSMLGAARSFGLVETQHGGFVSMTRLGRNVLDDAERSNALAEAFLNVPLHAKMYEQYQGNALPPPAAVERHMEGLGVPPKQKERARQTFTKSARFAGFIDSSTERFIRPATAPDRRHYVKARVRVHEYPDGTMAVFHGPRCLARYHADGQPIDSQTREAA